MKRLSALAICIIFLSAPASNKAFGAGDSDSWPSWRGQDCMGISKKGNPPLTWSETENIKWKIKLTGDESNSSPIIWEDKIYFQTAVKTDIIGNPVPTDTGTETDEESRAKKFFGISTPTNIYKFNLVCLDRNSGKLNWEKTVREEQPHEGHHKDHGFASYSPVTDGEFIWTNFGSRGIYCFDMEGNLKWSRDLGKMNIRVSFGEAGSVAVSDEAVIVVMDQEGDSFIIALNKESGETIWKKNRDEPTSWTTPLVVEVNGKKQVVVSATNLIRSYDLKTGDIVWQCGGMTELAIPTPVTGFGMVYCASGYRGNALLAINLQGTGDLSNTDAVKWHVKEATPYVPSPLLYGDKLYVSWANRGIVSCYNAKTGKPYFLKERLEEIKQLYASPAAAADRIYFVGRGGITNVLKASEKFEILAVNKLEDRFDCSPAFAGDEIYLKGKENFYCIAASK